MKVYFSGSRYYRDQFREAYVTIADVLSKEGFEVLDRANVDPSKDPKSVTEMQKLALHKDFVKTLDKCDLSVFEASFPSTLHIGHEITLAIQKGKPVIVLYKEEPGKEPLMFKGMEGEKVIWVSYTPDTLAQKLRAAVEEAKKIQDVRFNFFVSPRILEYLDWVAKNRMIPRSVFLRDLIEREMKKDKQYKEQ